MRNGAQWNDGNATSFGSFGAAPSLIGFVFEPGISIRAGEEDSIPGLATGSPNERLEGAGARMSWGFGANYKLRHLPLLLFVCLVRGLATNEISDVPVGASTSAH